MAKTIFLAGATGVIGLPLCKLLLDAGHKVYGMTRSAEKAQKLAAIGVEPVVANVFEREKVIEAIKAAKPDVVIHQLTDLPTGLPAEEMPAALVRNARIREEGTETLILGAKAAGAQQFIAQSIAFVYEPGHAPFDEQSPLLNFQDPVYGETSRAVHSLEQQTLNSGLVGIVLRNGLLYGANTGFDAPAEGLPVVHAEAAAHAALLALEQNESGIFNIADDYAELKTDKAKYKLHWDAAFRLN